MKGCYLTKHAQNTIFNCITSALTKSDFTYATYGAMLQCLMFMRHYHYLRRVGESSRMTNTQLTGKIRTNRLTEAIRKSMGQLINGCKCRKSCGTLKCGCRKNILCGPGYCSSCSNAAVQQSGGNSSDEKESDLGIR